MIKDIYNLRQDFYNKSATFNNASITVGIDLVFKFIEPIINEENENRKIQEKDLIEQIIALNNTIALLKEKLVCTNCGWDNQYPKIKERKHCLIYDKRTDCADFNTISNACIGCNYFNNPEHD